MNDTRKIPGHHPRTTAAHVDASQLYERVKELEAEMERLKAENMELAHEEAMRHWIKILEESPENVLYVIEGMRARLEENSESS